MNITRNGKFARLPRALREELNRRLSEGEQGKKLLAWLNALPEVRAVLATEFGGRPINDQNLTHWRHGGFRDWLDAQEARAATDRLCQRAVTADANGRPPLTETLAHWVTARYAVATRRVAGTRGAEHWRLLREMCHDVAKLRRGDHSQQRLRLRCGRLPEANPSLKRKRRRDRQARQHPHQEPVAAPNPNPSSPSSPSDPLKSTPSIQSHSSPFKPLPVGNAPLSTAHETDRPHPPSPQLHSPPRP